MKQLKPNLAVLVGAGSGDPGLLTLAGASWLARADAVIYDRLIPEALLELAPPGAERIYVGKGPDSHTMPQEQINQLLVDYCKKGKLVVRLKGGDPFVFGRGSEEADALQAAGIPFRIVPGITAAIAAGAYAGIALTDRRDASSVAFVTGHEDPSKTTSSLNWQALAGIDTVVFYMGVGQLEQIAERLIGAGKNPDTPCAIVERATTPRQRTITATLATIAQAAKAQNIKPPAVTIVGKVVQMRERLAWFDRLPLCGQTVLVTRTRKQASQLSALLTEQGAAVIEAPTIEILPPKNYEAVDAAIENLSKYDWLAITSPNGAHALLERLQTLGYDARALAPVKIAAVGSATARTLQAGGIRADLVPAEFTTRDLAAELCRTGMRGKRILLARADIATAELAVELRQSGADVSEIDLYRTSCPASMPPGAMKALASGSVDWITFTSSSTVDNFMTLLKNHAPADFAAPDLAKIKLASIGTVTTEALERHGLRATATATTATVESLVQAITSF